MLKMNAPTRKIIGTSSLAKADSTTPALIVTGPCSIAIKGGTTVGGAIFRENTPVSLLEGWPEAGVDYGVIAADVGTAYIEKLPASYTGFKYFGGFHVAPGGNASAHNGGDDDPAINPYSLWDLNFRPACPDPRGMVLIETARGKLWCDIYLLGADHNLDGTSKFGVPIADHYNPPANPDGGRFSRLDYDIANVVMRHHGKKLLSLEEFHVAADGVAEMTACGSDPKLTGLDAPRTSKFGLMQATGNMWIWGKSDNSHLPRASFFGGSWRSDGSAGSRYAYVGLWPGSSDDYLGARGRGDHLQLD
jgi:hypothetical protein